MEKGRILDALDELSRVAHRVPRRKRTDGKQHKVVIEVRNHPEYTVEGRKSYIASDSR